MIVDRIWHLAASVPRVAIAPVTIGVGVAVLALLAPAIFMRDREPFNRLMEFLELVLNRPRPRPPLMP